MLDHRTLSATPAGAGWYADPIDPSRLRWWDGSSWTARLAATKPSGPTRRSAQTFAPATDVPAAAMPTPTLQLPVIDEQTPPPALGGVSLATDPIASLEGMFALDSTADVAAPAPATIDASGPSALMPTTPPPAAVPPMTAPPVFPTAAATASFGVASASARRAPAPLPVPAPDAPADDAPLFLTDALAAELGLPQKHRAEDAADAIDPAAFVPGGRRARRHAAALAATSAAPAVAPGTDAATAPASSRDALDAAVDDTVVPVAATPVAAMPAAVVVETKPAAAEPREDACASGTVDATLDTAVVAPAEPAAAAMPLVAPALVEPATDSPFGDTAELLARLNLAGDAPSTVALPSADDEGDDETADAPVAPVAAATVVDAPSVLPVAGDAPTFTLPAELRAPASAAPVRDDRAAAAPAADDDLNEFAGVFGSLTPRNRDRVDVSEPTRATTGSAWVLAFSPVLTAAIALGVALLAITGSINDAQTRWYVIGANLVLLAVLLLSTVADRRGLRAAGHTRTASEFWLLLSPLAYLIARTVSVRRVLGRGSAPLWAHLGLTAAVGAAGVGAMLMPQLTPASAESQYEQALEQALGAEGTVATVTCPADISGTSGATYACSGVTGDGTVLSIAVEMQSEGTFSYTVADPAEG